jgi:hypothetical protein
VSEKARRARVGRSGSRRGGLVPAASSHLVYHTSAHAVALFRFGIPVRQLPIIPVSRGEGRCAAIHIPEHLADHPGEHRAAIERYAIALHAGTAAEQHLHPKELRTPASDADHESVHRLLRWIEEDAVVECAWCWHLWQRTYAFITDPWQWPLVCAVAQAMLAGARTLSADAVTALLADRAARLDADATMPTFQLLAAPQIRSPWPCGLRKRSVEEP